jgi:hypothetical protein
VTRDLSDEAREEDSSVEDLRHLDGALECFDFVELPELCVGFGGVVGM